MRIKFKVATMFQRAIPRPGGEASDLLTFVKLTPQDIPAGDLLLAFSEAEVEWHPETHYKNNDGVPVRKLVAAETLVAQVIVTHGGDEMTFTQDGVYELTVGE